MPHEMTADEFESAVALFFPELNEVIIAEINDQKDIDGFNKDYKHHVADTSMWWTMGRHEHSIYISKVLKYAKFEYDEPPTLNQIFGDVAAATKEQHMYWFL